MMHKNLSSLVKETLYFFKFTVFSMDKSFKNRNFNYLIFGFYLRTHDM